MRHLTVDEGWVVQLRGLVEPVEFRDRTGKVLGHYTPVASPEEAAEYERAKKIFDFQDAADVAATQKEGCSLAEIMRHLQSLETKGFE